MPEDPQDPPNPQNSKDDTIEKLVAALNRSRPEPQPVDDPAPPPVQPMVDDRVAEQFKDLVNDGKADEALKLVAGGFNASQAQLNSLAASMAEQNVRALKAQEGDLWTSERDKEFKKWQKHFNVPDTALSDPKIVSQLWNVTKANDPTFADDMAKRRFDALMAENERKRQEELASTSPILARIPNAKSLSDSEKERVEKLLPEGVDPDYIMNQVGRFGISFDAYLAQLEKQNVPGYVEYVGSGPFKRPLWTRVDNPPKPEVK